ncbi:hypothetical protein [Ectobacillus funiculus]|uniref:hypothetical protein n=1 Tax=Ectobacillus funiculus TaxID=137993 RepID=UPI00101CCDE8|nr:hypothetical protein [Ectobacillus funiculus]
MKSESRQRLDKIFKKIFRIQGFLCFVIGIKYLAYLHWDTYWYGLGLILFGFLYFGFFYWNPDKLWFLAEEEKQDNK